jgi:predicted DNA-binding transcriptional regulator YafY
MSSPKSKDLRCLDILQGIKKGTIDPVSLVPNQRKLLVAFLMAEGQSTAEIAHLLKVSDRTIERDKKAIREENALSKDPELVGIIAGRLIDEAKICIQRIRKFERDADCATAVKIEGEKGCFHIVNTLAERLQSMGFLPIAAKKLEADLKHHMDDSPLSLDEIVSEANRLKGIQSALPENKTKKVKSRTIPQKGEQNE